MKKESAITLVALAVTIIILIILAAVSINMLIGDNGIITKAKQAKENIIYAGREEQEQLNQLYWEINQEGIYTDDEEDAKKDEMIELLQKQVEELKGQIIEQEDTIKDLQNQWESIETQLAQTNAEAGHVLKDFRAYSKGQLITGTMQNNEAISVTLNCGQSYTVPVGYHNGSGKVIANSLASQTQATANANNLSNGVTAWVNGQKITGNGTDVNNSYNNGYNAGYNDAKSTSGFTIQYYGYGIQSYLKVPICCNTVYVNSLVQIRDGNNALIQTLNAGTHNISAYTNGNYFICSGNDYGGVKYTDVIVQQY